MNSGGKPTRIYNRDTVQTCDQCLFRQLYVHVKGSLLDRSVGFEDVVKRKMLVPDGNGTTLMVVQRVILYYFVIKLPILVDQNCAGPRFRSHCWI
jgi:hypothetical protein